MKWDTVQQLIRILAYAGGSVLLGEGVADGETFQTAIGGLVNVSAFIWWLMVERKRKAAKNQEKPE